MKYNEKLSADSISSYIFSSNSIISKLLPQGATGVSLEHVGILQKGKNSVICFSLIFNIEKQKFNYEFILKTYQGVQHASFEKEYAALSFLRQYGFPVPRVFLAESNTKWFGFPFVIMEKIEGETLSEYFDTHTLNESIEAVKRFAASLFSLHMMPIDAIPDLPVPKDEYAFVRLHTSIEKEFILEKGPELKRFEVWLDNNCNRCPCNKYAILHGDVNLRNFLVKKNGEIIFTDWTWTKVGDPLKDVGNAYYNLRNDFEKKVIHKNGSLLAKHFLEAYCAKGGDIFGNFNLFHYIFTSCLSDACYAAKMKNVMKHPFNVRTYFGAKYVLIFPVVMFHFKRKYSWLKSLLNTYSQLALRDYPKNLQDFEAIIESENQARELDR